MDTSSDAMHSLALIDALECLLRAELPIGGERKSRAVHDECNGDTRDARAMSGA